MTIRREAQPDGTHILTGYLEFDEGGGWSDEVETGHAAIVALLREIIDRRSAG